MDGRQLFHACYTSPTHIARVGLEMMDLPSSAPLVGFSRKRMEPLDIDSRANFLPKTCALSLSFFRLIASYIYIYFTRVPVYIELREHIYSTDDVESEWQLFQSTAQVDWSASRDLCPRRLLTGGTDPATDSAHRFLDSFLPRRQDVGALCVWDGPPFASGRAMRTDFGSSGRVNPV